MRRGLAVAAAGMLFGAVLAGCGDAASGPDGGSGGGGAGGGAGGGTGGGGGGGGSGGGGSGGGTGGSSGGDCTLQVIPPNLTGGCAPRLVTPAVCEVVDLSGGRSYEVAWTTDGTGCETPWKLCVAGNPLTDPNSGCVQLSENVSAGISKTGGVYYVTAADLAGLTSDNGLYHALLASWYGSHAGSVAFRVVK